MTEATRTITYTGSAARAGALVQMLEEAGASVEWTPPVERRGIGGDAEVVALGIVASGLYDGIKAAVARFLERFPRATAVIEDDGSAPDDGGFLG